MEILTCKREGIKKDLEEMEKVIYPNYQQTASNIPVQKENAKKHSYKLTTALKKQGEAVHREIDTGIKKMESDIDDMDTKHLAMIDKHEKTVYNTIFELNKPL